MPLNKTTVKLNLQEFFFLAMEGVFASFGSVITLRFKEMHSSEEIREAMRYMVKIYPRLRSLVEPTLCSYRIRILEDNDEKLETLFHDAFKVKETLKYDSNGYLDYRNRLLNKPFALEESLPIRFRYIPESPRPVLLLSVHHLVGDAVAVHHLFSSLLLYLNGQRPESVPLENPGLLPAFLDRPYSVALMQIIRSFKIFLKEIRESGKKTTILASQRPATYYAPVHTYPHHLPFDLAIIKSASKAIGCTVTVFFLAAVTTAFARRKDFRGGEIVRINVGVNLRPYFNGQSPIFGNYSTVFAINIPRELEKNPLGLIEEIKGQLTRNTNQIKNKEICFHMLLQKLFTFAGRKNVARIMRMAKRKGLFRSTCAVATVGNIDFLNSYGAKAQVCEAIGIAPNFQLFIGQNSLDGKIFMEFSYSEAEFTLEEIKRFVQTLETSLGELLHLR